MFASLSEATSILDSIRLRVLRTAPNEASFLVQVRNALGGPDGGHRRGPHLVALRSPYLHPTPKALHCPQGKSSSHLIFFWRQRWHACKLNTSVQVGVECGGGETRVSRDPVSLFLCRSRCAGLVYFDSVIMKRCQVHGLTCTASAWGGDGRLTLMRIVRVRVNGVGVLTVC